MNLTDWEGDEIVRRNLVQEEGQVGCERERFYYVIKCMGNVKE